MSLPEITDTNGATPATSQTAIDAELADWVYHRAAIDKGLSLNEAETGAAISGSKKANVMRRAKYYCTVLL